VESFYNAGSLITNTGVSSIGAVQNTTIGFGNYLNNKFNKEKAPKPKKEPKKNKREAQNPLAQFNKTPPAA
jgi:hypothetical protein